MGGNDGGTAVHEETLPAISNGDQKSLYLLGPDQLILETDGWSTSRPDGAVDIRMNPDAAAPISVPTMCRRTAEKFGSKMAMAVKRDGGGEWKCWTYKEYHDECRIAAKAMIKLGLDRFHGVCILGFNSPEWIISQIGAIMAGGLGVGVYTTNSPEACRHVMADCRANVVILEDEKQLIKILEIRDKLPHLRAIIQYLGDPTIEGVLSWEEFLKIGRNEPDDPLEDRLKRIAINQCCGLIYTSGTMGLPKAAMMSHDNLTWTARSSNTFLKMTPDDVLLSYLPLSHSAAQMTDIWMTLECGASIYFANRDALKGSLGKTLKEVRPTVFLGVPRVFEKMAEKMQEMGKSSGPLQRSFASWAKGIGLWYNNRISEEGEGLGIAYPIAKKLVFDKVKEKLGFDRCRLIGVGAAPTSKETFDYFLSLDVTLLECYGMSETSGPHHGNTPHQNIKGTVGQNLPGCRTKIHNPDEEGKGEVCMRSRNVMMGYLFNPEETVMAVDAEGWLHSGDIGVLNEDTSLKITGRIKEILITAGGENVPPIIIEDTIKSELPCISNAMVVGDQKKFLSCLLTLRVNVDSETMKPSNELSPITVAWLEAIRVKAKTVEEVLKEDTPDHHRFIRAVQEGIDRANSKAISNAQRVQKWVVLNEDFSICGGELGPTMKLKRHFVLEKYSPQINNIYNV